jgi:hypothetical protein
MILYKKYDLSKYNVDIYIDETNMLTIDLPENLENQLEMQHFPKDIVNYLENIDQIKHIKVYDKAGNLLLFRTRVVSENDLNLF